MDVIPGTSQISVSISKTGAGTVIGYYSKFISQPLDQTSLSANTWTYAFSAAESNTSNNFPGTGGGTNKPVLVNCYVWRPSDGSLVGTILDGNTASTVDEAAANVQQWHIVTFTGSAVNNVQKGDVLVFEVWFQHTSIASSTTTTFYFDGINDTYVENATSTSAASYIQTPENLAFVGQRQLRETPIVVSETASGHVGFPSLGSGIQAYQTTFVADTDNTTPHDQTVTGWPFQPKAVIIWSSGQTASGSIQDGMQFVYGVSDATTSGCIFTCSQDASSTTVSRSQIRDDAVVCMSDSSAPATEVIRGTIASFNSDGITITWNVKNTTAYIFNVLALGGTDLNVKVQSNTTGRNTTGSQSYTGTGFQPEAIIALLTGNNTKNVVSTNPHVYMCAFSATGSFVQCVRPINATNSGGSQSTALYDNRCLFAENNSSTAQLVATFTSADTDGWTLNYTTAPTSSTYPFLTLAIAGCKVAVKTFSTNSTTGDQTLPTAWDLAPTAVMTYGPVNINTFNSSSSCNSFAVGATDGTNQAVAAESISYSGGLLSARVNLTTKVIKCLNTAVATGSSTTTRVEGTIADMSINGQFTINYTTAAASAAAYIALYKGIGGGAGEPTQSRTISESTVNVSTPTPPDRLTAKLRPHTLESMSVAATFTDRTLYKGRALTTQTVLIPAEDPPLRGIGRTKSQTTETVDIPAGMLARLGTKLRGLTTQSVIILPAESLVRLSAKIRALATQTITALEPSIPSWTKKVNIVKALSTENVAVSTASLTRLNTKLRALSSGAITISAVATQLKTTGIHAIERTLSAAEAGIVSITTPEGLTRLTATMLALTTETISISETLARSQNKFREITTEAVSLAGNITRIKARFKVLATQTVSISAESLVRRINKLRSPSTGAESVAISISAFTRFVAKWRYAPTQTVVIPAIESLSRLSVMSKSLAAQSVSVVGSLAKIAGKVRTLPFATEAVALSEVKVRLMDKIRLLPDETVNIFASLVNSVNEIAEESVAISDEVTRTVRHVLEISRQIALQQVTVSAGIAYRAKGTRRNMDLAVVFVSGIPTRLATKFRSVSTQSVTLSGLVARIKTHMGIPSTGNETLAVSDSIVRISGKIRVLLTQVLNVSDARTRLTAKARAISLATVTVQESVDSLTRNLKYITRTLTENVSVSVPSLARLTQKLRILITESVTSSDLPTRRKTVLRIITTQIVSASETLTQRLLKIRALTTQTVVVSEQSLTRLLNKMRIVSTQIVTVYESAIRIKNKIKPLATESVTISAGTITRLITKIRILTAAEIVTISEQSLSRLTNKLQVLATQIIVVSAAAPQQIKNISVNNIIKVLTTETVAVSDSIVRRLAKVRALSSEILTVSTTIARLMNKRRSAIIQQVTIFETLARLKTHVINEVVRNLPTESLSIALESVTHRLKKHRTIKQGLSIAELLRAFHNGIELLEAARPGYGGQTTPYRKVSPRLPKLKQILYPVYSQADIRRIERRRKLRAYGPLTIIPAFKYNINQTVAPFIITTTTITNRMNNKIIVRFALSHPKQLDEPKLVFDVGKSLPIIIPVAAARQQRHKLNKAKAQFVMNQAGIERVQSQTNKLTKLFKLMKVWRIAQTLFSSL